MVNDKEESVREIMAERWDLGEDLMRKLANDTSYIVRRNIALNKKASDELIEKLAHDEDEDVRLVVQHRLEDAVNDA